MNILLIGPPASGKGTQAKILARQGMVHLSTGDMLRAEIKSGSNFGKEIDTIISNGHYVSDEIVNRLIRNNISLTKNNVFDGYPRTIEQVKYLGTLFGELGQRLDLVISFEIERESLIGRITKRFIEEGRSDDNPEAFSIRLDEYEKNTLPVLEYCREWGNVIPIDANMGVQTISSIISTHINWHIN